MVGKFPACVLYVTLPEGLVDVNVHPTKAEVKFAREKAVFDGVYYGALAALGAEPAQRMSAEPDAVASGETKSAAPSAAAAPRADFFRSMDAAEFRRRYSPPTGSGGGGRDRNRPGAAVRESVPYRTAADAGRRTETAPPPPEDPVPEQTVLHESFTEKPFRFIGEALGVYILIEQGEELLLIDKHAAHERILFDRIAQLLRRMGFELEPYGENSFAVRAVPADIDAAQAVPLLEELVEKLREGAGLSAADVWERLAATVACKAAIKAGWESDAAELTALARRVVSGEITHCPHGRPVMQRFTRAELDKRFGRIT